MDMDVRDFLPHRLSNICADIEAGDSDIATQNFEAAFNEQIVDRLPFCHCARKIVGDMPPRYDETMQRRDRKFVADRDCQTVFRHQMFGKQATENTGLIHGILHL